MRDLRTFYFSRHGSRRTGAAGEAFAPLAVGRGRDAIAPEFKSPRLKPVSQSFYGLGASGICRKATLCTNMLTTIMGWKEPFYGYAFQGRRI